MLSLACANYYLGCLLSYFHWIAPHGARAVNHQDQVLGYRSRSLHVPWSKQYAALVTSIAGYVNYSDCSINNDSCNVFWYVSIWYVAINSLKNTVKPLQYNEGFYPTNYFSYIFKHRLMCSLLSWVRYNSEGLNGANVSPNLQMLDVWAERDKPPIQLTTIHFFITGTSDTQRVKCLWKSVFVPVFFHNFD